MDKIAGLEANKPSRLKKQGDLLYHEGPLLSHFVDEDDAKNHYLYKWADCDEHANRWLVAAVPENLLFDYLTQAVSLLNLLRYSAKLFVLDLDDALQETAFLECSFENIPAAYLPGPQSYFKSSQCEEYALTLRENILAGRDINYSLVADWLEAGSLKSVSFTASETAMLSEQSREAFDTLLSAYSKKKVFDFFFKSFHASELPDVPPAPPAERGRLATKLHFSHGLVLLIEVKHYSNKVAHNLQINTLDFLQNDLHTAVYLRETDTAVLKLPRHRRPGPATQDVRGQLREYVYDEYHSALEEDDVVGRLF